MSLADRFAVTPLLYACGALLLACLGLGGTIAWQHHSAGTLRANIGKAQAQRDQAVTEREAWKRAAQTFQAANATNVVTIDKLQRANKHNVAENTRVQQANAKALARARAAAADTERTLHAWMQKYHDQARQPDCQRARLAMEAACPALQDY